jgi:hypothetical protein
MVCQGVFVTKTFADFWSVLLRKKKLYTDELAACTSNSVIQITTSAHDSLAGYIIIS